MQESGTWSSRRRPRHEIEQEVPPLAPIVQVNFGRPDKPEDWKITDEFPEMGDLNQEDKAAPTVLDAEEIRRQKSGFIGEE
jgi:hypothetical protein